MSLARMGTVRIGLQASCLVALLCTLTSCASERPSLGDPGTPTPSSRSASPAVGMPESSESQTPQASPAAAVVPGPDGVGVARFGDDAEAAMDALSAALGKPDTDSGWKGSFSEYGTCPGARVRGQGWKSFTALFVEGTTDLRPDGKPHLFGFLYGGEGKPSEPRLVTANAIGLGSTVRQLRASYGDRVETFDDTVTEQTAFRVGDSPRELFGLLSGQGPGDRVVFMSGGGICGE